MPSAKPHVFMNRIDSREPVLFHLRFLAFALIGAVLFAGFAGKSARLHDAVHGGLECKSQTACVIGLFGAGSICAGSGDSEFIPARTFTRDAIFPSVAAVAGDETIHRPTARGPPRTVLISLHW